MHPCPANVVSLRIERICGGATLKKKSAIMSDFLRLNPAIERLITFFIPSLPFAKRFETLKRRVLNDSRSYFLPDSTGRYNMPDNLLDLTGAAEKKEGKR